MRAPLPPTRSGYFAIALALAGLLSCGAARAADRESLAKELADPRREARSKAADDLRPESADELLSHPNRWVRLGAARALAQAKDASTIPVLVAALSTERDPLVRSTIAMALAAAGSEGRPAVLAEFGKLSRGVGESALDAYVKAVVESEMRRIIQEITNSAGNQLGFFARPFARLQDVRDRAVPCLIDIISSGSTTNLGRQVAVRGIAELNDERAVPPLRRIFDELTEWMAAKGFEEDSTQDILDEVPPGVDLRKYVSHALYRLGDVDPFRSRWQHLESLLYLRERPLLLGERRLQDLVTGRGETRAVAHGYFSIGYELNQVRLYDDAIVHYTHCRDLLKPFVRSQLIPWYYLSSYNMACIEAQRGRKTAAIQYLGEALDAGFEDLDWLSRDHDLDPVRDDPAFAALIEQASKPR